MGILKRKAGPRLRAKTCNTLYKFFLSLSLREFRPHRGGGRSARAEALPEASKSSLNFTSVEFLKKLDQADCDFFAAIIPVIEVVKLAGGFVFLDPHCAHAFLLCQQVIVGVPLHNLPNILHPRNRPI